MAKGDIKIIFTKDFATHKEGSEYSLSRDLANICIGRKVAKRFTESIEPKEPKKKRK
jgi:hypothetical protein